VALVLDKGDIGGYLSHLSKDYTIYAPVKRGDVVTFDIWCEGDEIILDHTTTNSPVKKAFFPAHEKLVEFTDSDQKAPIYDEKVLIFGIHPYDVVALRILDEAFDNPIKDNYYARRRKDSRIIAVEHGEIPNAFYDELSLDLESGYDIILLDEKDHYVLDVRTSEGNSLVKNGHVKTKAGSERPPHIPDAGEGTFNLERMQAFLDKGPDDEMWHQLEKECFACGVCAYVCPICHCFDVEDRLALNGKSAERTRCWDSCMLADFSAVAMGENFRKERYKRIHNWYHHKFSRAVKERGKADCVGCGRCISYCPAGIKIHDMMKKCEETG
jgi:NAD-dependent dihydropyrimidine dehydrogenase PreA subunit